MPRIRAASIEEHRRLTRRAIIDAAQAVIATMGRADIGLGDIAAVAGIARTTFYQYFADRDDLIATMVEEELPGIIDGLLEGLEEVEPLDERLAALAARTIEFVAADEVLGLILHREVGRLSAVSQQRVREAHSRLADSLVGIYMEGVARGVFVEMAPDLAGRLIHEAIMAGARTIIASPDPVERVAETTASVRRYLLGGLGR